MPAFPSGGAVVANPPLYPDYVSNTVFVVGGNSASLNPFSGPKGSPFDAKMYPANIASPVLADLVANPLDHSTGGLSTGIGFETTDTGPIYNVAIDGAIAVRGVAGINQPLYSAANPASVNNFSDNYIPGVTLPDGTTSASDARLTSIGGGRSTANTVASPSAPNPYNAQPILDMGVGGSRDAGAGPAFTGFSMKLVTAAADIAQGAAIETGFINRTGPAASGVVLKNTYHAFGSSTAASAAVA